MGGGGAGIDDWYREAVNNWRAAEILPVFSAGNQRTGGNQHHGQALFQYQPIIQNPLQ